MISVVVNSYNEGEKLRRCLTSVKGWADELVVVDMESEDATLGVAKEFGAKIFTHAPVSYIEPVRQFAVSKASASWVLVLDPDETVTEKLKNKLTEISKKDETAAVNIPRLNIFLGRKVKHTNFWPDRQIRFFKQDQVIFSDKIHSYPKVEGEVMELPAKENLAIHHYPYSSVKAYLQRMERYSNIEASNLYEEGKRFSLFRLLYLPGYDFLRRFVRHLGFLDGWMGLLLSLLQAYYYVLVELKLRKLEN